MTWKVAIFLMFLSMNLITSKIHPTNVICESLDKTFSDYEYCLLKVVNRSYGYVSVKTNLFKTPVYDATIQVATYKFANGYKPFLYNVTADLCAFMKRKKDPIVKFFYDLIEKNTNVNHTCPYNHDLILDKLEFNYMDHFFSTLLPVPKGKYKTRAIFYSLNKPRALFEMHIELS